MIGISLKYDNTKKIFEPDLETGSLHLAETTAQDAAFVIRLEQGDFKESPLLGVGITGLLNSEELEAYRRKIISQLESINMGITQLDLVNNSQTNETEITIKSKYIEQ